MADARSSGIWKSVRKKTGKFNRGKGDREVKPLSGKEADEFLVRATLYKCTYWGLGRGDYEKVCRISWLESK